MLVEVEIPTQGASRVKVNRSPVRRKRDLRRQVRAVLFGPFDLPIVIGDPSKRRTFMDEALTALWPLKEGLLTAYDRTLRQRNRLLKEWDGPGAPAGMEAWDEELIAGRRRRSCGSRRGDRTPRPPRERGVRPPRGLRARVHLRTQRPGRCRRGVWSRRTATASPSDAGDELQRRTSLVGPHRDDLTLAVRDLGARAAGSHGETWATALCLRAGLATAVTKELGEPPVFLVDDPFSALDPTRRDQIAERLASRPGQVFVSVADEADVPGQSHARLGRARRLRDAQERLRMPEAKGFGGQQRTSVGRRRQHRRDRRRPHAPRGLQPGDAGRRARLEVARRSSANASPPRPPRWRFEEGVADRRACRAGRGAPRRRSCAE